MLNIGENKWIKRYLTTYPIEEPHPVAGYKGIQYKNRSAVKKKAAQSSPIIKLLTHPSKTISCGQKHSPSLLSEKCGR
jgi:hypothetical protein